MLIIKMLKKKDPDNNFVKLWENKRYHALVCLGLWFIFFIFVFLIVVIPYNNALKNLKLPEDDEKKGNEEVQDLINKFNKVVEEKLKEKENELMTI